MKHKLIKTLYCFDDDGKPNDLNVVEFIGYEPSNYAWEDGYLCDDAAGDEFFVSLTGRVDKRTDADGWIMGWGICSQLKNEADLFEELNQNISQP